MGHLESRELHLVQQQECPQAVKTVSRLFSRQMTHRSGARSAWSVRPSLVSSFPSLARD